MSKDDQRVRETVQAELRRRRGALDEDEDRLGHTPRGGPARPEDQSRRHLADRR